MNSAKRAFIGRAPQFDNSKYSIEGRCQNPMNLSYDILLPPISGMYGAQLLEDMGAEVLIIDSMAKDISINNFVNQIESFNPQVIFLQTGIYSLENDDKVAGLIKKRLSNSIIVMFDLLAGFLSEREKVNINNFDLLIRNEPEGAMLSIFENYGNLDALKNIPGTASIRDHGQVISNDNNGYFDINKLPLPARHLINLKEYKQPFTGEPYQPIITSRGCPAACNYCITKKYYGRKIRLRTVDSIIDEIKVCVDLGIKWFYFFSDTFTIKKSQVLEICNRIIDEDLKIKFWGNSRVDTIDDEIAKALKEAGCVALGLGIESGYQTTLDKIKKKTTVEQNKNALAVCHKNGIITLSYMMLGFPWETKSNIEESFSFIKKSKADFATLFTPIPWENTELFNIYQEYGLEIDTSKYGHWTFAMSGSKDFNAEQLGELIRKYNLLFYLEIARIFRLIKISLRFPKLFLSGVSSFMKRIIK